MARRIKAKELLPYNWITLDKPNKDLIDPEMVELTILNADKQYNDALKNKNFKHFYEIIYHALNLNTFIDENKMYDNRLKKIKNDKMLDMLLADFKEDSKFSDTANVIWNTKEILDKNITNYLEEMIEFMSEGSFYFENDKLHQNDDSVYIIITDGFKSKHQVWKLSFGNKLTYLHEMTKCFEVEFLNDEDNEELLEKIIEYNFDNNDPIETSNSFYVNMNKRNSVNKGIYLAKDIVMMNRVFIGPKEFNPSIFKNMLNVIETENKFPYHLTPAF